MAIALFKLNIFENAKIKFALLNSITLVIVMGIFYYIIYNLYVGYATEIIKNRSEDLAKIAILRTTTHKPFSLPPGFSLIIKSDGQVLYQNNKIDKDSKKTIKLHQRFEYQGNIYDVYLKSSIEDIIESEKKIFFYATFLYMFLVISVFAISYMFANIFLKPIKDYTEKLDIVLKGSMHAINTPIGILKLLDIKDKKAKEAITRIEETINRIKTISMSKPQEKTLININEAIRDALESFEDCLESQNININFEEKNVLKAYVDPIDLSMILENILNNAIKYNKENGFINIKIVDNKLMVQNKSDEISDISRIFDLFYREDESKEGLGLGLYIVKTLSDRNDISVKAEYKDGVFQISLEW